MKKKSLILCIFLMLILASCKIANTKKDQVEIVKEDFELDLRDGFDGGDVVDFGANVYSFKGDKDAKLRLKLINYDKGNEDDIFDIELPKIDEGEKLGVDITSNKLNLYAISDKKISLISGAYFGDRIFIDKRTNAYTWTDGGVLKADEPLSIFESYSTYSKDLTVSSQWKEEIKSGLKKDLSGLVLEVELESDEK
ncbi:hypothetical protein NH286_07515 [Anaerococcus sp. NML200574]|uniref:Lipoprotein n=1 Tax=Anaerococcus kampingae TaxID=3115614 RepID=A0ABW9MKK6_9FIRM|nr:MULTISPECIES: hypothetical protein [unclassified Anaerococcus]MCW6679002.1 hypothetical protein [Anaerococcus sp. NML200574]